MYAAGAKRDSQREAEAREDENTSTSLLLLLPLLLYLHFNESALRELSGMHNLLISSGAFEFGCTCLSSSEIAATFPLSHSSLESVRV